MQGFKAEADWYQDENEKGQHWGSCLAVANPYTNPKEHKVWLIGVRCLKSEKDKTKNAKTISETLINSAYAYSVLAVRTQQLVGKNQLNKSELLEQLDFYDERVSSKGPHFEEINKA